MKYLKIIIPALVIIITITVIVVLVKNHAQANPENSIETTKTVTTTPNPNWKPSDISKIPILTYHSFGPKPDKKETAMQLHYRVTAETFETQMKNLIAKGYHPVTFDDVVQNQVNGKPLPEHAIVLTFDDGWKTQYEYAVPILEKYHLTGTFFIITNSIGAGAYMSLDELKDLHAKGFEVASHTETHPKLPTLDDAKLIQEITGSKKILEDKLGISITTMAYPYYAHDARVMKTVQDTGYLGARAGWGKFSNDTTHLFELTSQESVNNPDPFASKRLAD
jgi:peptidoglycan/xylan/chitin deacetylase (PgdA/CDA1 family)